MKYLFTAIFLITFYFVSAQNNTSVILKTTGDSVLFIDFKPAYTTKLKNFCSLTIDKIEYTKEEMILYLRIVNSYKNDEINFPVYGKKSELAWHIKSEDKIFNMLNIKNFRVNGKSYAIKVPKDSILNCHVKDGGEFTCELYFPRLPKETKTVKLIEGIWDINDKNGFDFFDIQIKSSGDEINYKMEKEFLNKMELNKPLTLNNIYFETGKSNLLDSSFAELNTLFNILKSKAKMMIQISGYTDNTGNVQDNIVLSEARANAVKKYLTDKRIDNNRIIAKGYGSSNPIASNDTAEGRAKNRRVEIMVLKNE